MPAERPARDKNDFLLFGAPLIGEEEIAEVVACLRSGWLGSGPRARRFAEDFRQYVGTEGIALPVSSCTSGLHLSLIASGVGPGDEVITTPMTFCATINAIAHTGATPVLVDIDPRTFNIDVSAVAAAITPRTRALLPVHFAGRLADMPALVALASQHGLKLIEDCAHAIETTLRGQHAGTFGDYAAFSFYATKNVTTGEGGMVLCRDPASAERVRSLALHGTSTNAWSRFGASGYQHYDIVEAGYKYNLTDLQASIGIHQLRRVEANWLRRRAIWQRYDEAFAGLPLGRPAAWPAQERHALHLYTLQFDPERCGVSRDEALVALGEQQIGVGVHYRAVPEYGYYRDRFGWRPEDYPHATRVGRQALTIPLSAALDDDDVEDVIDAVRRTLARRR